jgi:hypothetical protein
VEAERVSRIAWILGWAIPREWFANLIHERFPGSEHVFVAPTPHWREELAAAGCCEKVVGYSLGSLLLLREPAAVSTSVDLIAPIFAFSREDDRGGRSSRTQVRALARWVRRDRAAALADFHTRCGIELAQGQAPEVEEPDLLWGLQQLETAVVDPQLPQGWRGWCGSDDPLLDAARLQALAPDVRIVPAATHHPAALLDALVEAWR